MNIYTTTYQPYTYLIKWSSTGMKYYGVRYAKGCNPEEFWVSYFTSSKYVEEYRNKFGDPDVYQIRKVFTCPNKARDWEHKVLKKTRAAFREDYLNKTDNKSINIYDLIVRENHKKGIAVYHSKPGISEFKSAVQKECQNRPEIKIRKSNTMNANWNDPNWKQQQIDKITYSHNTEEYKNKASISQKSLWEDDEFVKRQIELRNHPEIKEAQRNAKLGTKNPNYDPALLRFQHASGIIEQLTKYEFRKKYNISFYHLYKILDGYSVKDWRLINL